MSVVLVDGCTVQQSKVVACNLFIIDSIEDNSSGSQQIISQATCTCSSCSGNWMILSGFSIAAFTRRQQPQLFQVLVDMHSVDTVYISTCMIWKTLALYLPFCLWGCQNHLQDFRGAENCFGMQVPMEKGKLVPFPIFPSLGGDLENTGPVPTLLPVRASNPPLEF